MRADYESEIAMDRDRVERKILEARKRLGQAIEEKRQLVEDIKQMKTELKEILQTPKSCSKTLTK